MSNTKKTVEKFLSNPSGKVFNDSIHEAMEERHNKIHSKARLSDKPKRINLTEYYPYTRNIYIDHLTKSSCLKNPSKSSLRAPWRLSDGYEYHRRSLSGEMPYKWESSLKITDKYGKNIALVDHHRRDTAKLLVTSPDMYKLLSFISLNKDKILSDEFTESESGRDFVNRLDGLVGLLSMSYIEDLYALDAEKIQYPVAQGILSNFFCKVFEYFEEAEIVDFFNGHSVKIEDVLWESLFLNYYKNIVPSVVGRDDYKRVCKDLSYELLHGFQSSKDLDKEQVISMFRRLVQNNQELLKTSDPYEAPEAIYDYSSIDDLDEIWNKGSNHSFDNLIEEKKKRRTIVYNRKQAKMTAKNLLVQLGVPIEKVKNLPKAIEYAIENRVIKNDAVDKDNIALKVVSVMYSFYKEYATIPNGNFNLDDILEILEDDSEV